MKTSKTRTKKKNWQKADARILGQILAAQNIDFVLPDPTHIADFFAETLTTIPGIRACRVCLREASAQRGEMEVGVCKSCEASRENPGSNEKISSFEPGFKCGLAEQLGAQVSAITSSFHHFGFFVFQVDDLDTFNVYKPFVDNLANYIALSLENRQQRDLLQKARDELERKVEERTEELRASNETIRDLYNNAPCGYHSLDKDGFFVLINDTELRWLGYSRDELVGKATFRSLLSENSQKTFDANFPIFMERGWVSDLEFEMVCKDGSILPVLLNATAVADCNGNYVMSRSTIFDITERRRAEVALHQSEERFRRLAENARDVIYRMSIPDGKYEYVSSAALSVFGYSPEECYQTPILIKQAIHPDWHKYFEEQWANLIKGEMPSTYEYQFIHKSGEIRWLNQRNILVLDNAGKPIAIEGIVTDITERKQAEEALRKSEQKFRSFVESSSEGFTLVDEQGAIIEWNPARERMTGLSASQVMGQTLWDVQYQMILPELQTPQFYERFKQTLLNALQTGQSPIFDNVMEAEILHPHKGSQFVRQTIFPIRTDKGYRIGSVTNDITEHKRAEQALRESEERLRQIASSLREVVWLRDAQTRQVLYVNPAFQELTGRTCESFYENRDVVIDAIHPDDKEEVIRALAQRSESTYYDKEHRIIHLDGSVHWVSSRSFPVRNEAGEVYRWATIMEDITEGKQAERSLRESEERFRSFVEQANDIVYTVSPDGVFTYVSPNWKEMLGHETSEVEGKSFEIFVHPDDLVACRAILNHTIVSGEKQSGFEYRVKHKNGSWQWHTSNASVIRDGDGRIISFLGIARNITERKQAEQALRENEEKFRTLIEQSAEGVMLADENGNIVEWNHAYERITGLKRDQALGQPLWDMMMKMIAPERATAERYESIKAGILGALRTGKSPLFAAPTELEFHPISSREKHYLHQTIFPIKTEKGHRVASLVEDITARKQVEEALTLFRTLLDHTNDAIEVVDPETGRFLDANEQAYHALGYTREELLSLSIPEINPLVAERSWKETMEELRRAGFLVRESQRQRKDGSIFPVEINVSYTRLDRDYILAVVRDITERKQAEAQLLASEQLFRALVENSPDFIARYDREFRRIYVNPAIQRLFGTTTENVLGKTPAEQSPVYAPQVYIEQLKQVIEAAAEVAIEMPFRTAQGEMHWGHMRFVPEFGPDGKVDSVLAIGRDIHEIKENERRFRMLAENFPDFVTRFNRDGQYIYANPAFEKVFGMPVKSIIGRTLQEVPQRGETEQNNESQDLIRRTFDEGVANEFQEVWDTKMGERIFEVRYVPEKDATGNVVTALCIARDITERKRMTEALAAQERKFRTLAENSPDNIARYDVNCRTLYVNPALEKTLGHPVSEILGTTPTEAAIIDENRRYQEKISEVLETGKDDEMDLVLPDIGGGVRYHNVRFVAERGADGAITGVQTIGRDITERKQHEREREVIIAVSTALRHAITRTEILNVILDQLVDLFDADGATLVLPDPQTGGFIDEMGRGVVGERMMGLAIPPGQGVCNWVVTNKKPYLNNRAENDPLFYRPDLLGDSHCIASVPLIAQDQIIGVLWIARKMDIKEQDLRLLNAIADIAANAIRRVMLHEQTEQQLHHLLALHQIDIAISSNFDSSVTLNVILNNVKDELEVDAVSILLLDSITHTLDYAAGIGFRTRGIEQSHVGLGEGCAGRAAQERRTVSCLDIGQTDGSFIRSSLLTGEGFALHYATPLTVKGEVKGVLELFHRRVFEPETGWLDYYETLATQAAIAIENASLLENLQRSNAELVLAYDATIAGWSRALDLRDRETEGHTQRVAEMALELAKKMGMSDTEKQNLWRGSLLHDIGKMGVPDSILLKPGPLTDDERKIMQQHPLYAFQMLSPISYLKHALEISYCHHEKWDGSGYPRGLKGEQIPLSARVFAVVDVYDALTSDRPYRAAWPPDKVYRYIEEQAGSHFDPQVVKIFLNGRSG